MSQVMSGNIYSMLSVSNAEHHADTEEDGHELAIYLNSVRTKNLMHSYAIQLCDVLIWYHRLLKKVENMPNGVMPVWWTETQV